MNLYHVTCSTDDNYLQHCVTMLCSLYENNKELDMVVHILVDSLSQESRNVITNLSKRYGNSAVFYDIKPEMLENIQLNDVMLNGKKMYSIATYYRMFLPSLLPETVEKILYLDCDVIVLSDVSELYEMNMSGYGVAAVKDASPYDSYHRFKMGLALQHSAFCAGVMMINLKYWRENDSQRQLLTYATRQWENVYMQDQDALNFVFRDHWMQLPYKWGKTPLSIAPIDHSQKWFDIKEYADKPCIYHYAAHAKPWLDVWYPDRRFYWEYLKLSEFPSPKPTHANRQLRWKIRLGLARYAMNKYVRPFIPNIVELIISDILQFFKFIFSIIFPSCMSTYMLKRWCQKYGL